MTDDDWDVTTLRRRENENRDEELRDERVMGKRGRRLEMIERERRR